MPISKLPKPGLSTLTLSINNYQQAIPDLILKVSLNQIHIALIPLWPAILEPFTPNSLETSKKKTLKINRETISRLPTM